LADILRENGSPEDASLRYEEALKIYREYAETPPLDLANTLRGFALLKADIGEKEEAKSLLREARSLYESVNVQAGVEESELQIARTPGSTTDQVRLECRPCKVDHEVKLEPSAAVGAGCIAKRNSTLNWSAGGLLRSSVAIWFR
jgi:tetratricopeptide (TPR) repeat protein